MTMRKDTHISKSYRNYLHFVITDRDELREIVDEALADGIREIDGCPIDILARQVEYMTSLILCVKAREACEEDARNREVSHKGRQTASGTL